MAVSYETYERLALEDSDTLWELVCGKLREKPPMTQAHNSLAYRLLAQLALQLDKRQFELRMNAPTLKIGSGTYLIPDVAVVPQLGLTDSTALENYEGPLTFVAEVWSPSTGNYDVDTKLVEYRERGDLVVWRIHPRERSLITWNRQPDGSYSEAHHTHGTVSIPSLPEVSVDFDSLFA
jgi:Uma2 family endonuclease